MIKTIVIATISPIKSNVYMESKTIAEYRQDSESIYQTIGRRVKELNYGPYTVEKIEIHIVDHSTDTGMEKILTKFII